MEAHLQPAKTPTAPSRAWCGVSTSEFLHAEPETTVGKSTTNSGFAVLPRQTEAWLEQISLLKEHLAEFAGAIFLEFNIPHFPATTSSSAVCPLLQCDCVAWAAWAL
jgi:hypothetical protein